MAPVQVSSNWWRFSPPYHRLSHDSVISGENCDEARMSEREMRSLQEKVVVCLCSSSMVQNEGIINQQILFHSNQHRSGSTLLLNWPDHVFVEKGPTFTYSHQDKDNEPSWNDLRINNSPKRRISANLKKGSTSEAGFDRVGLSSTLLFLLLPVICVRAV